MNFEWDHDKVTEYFVCIYLSVDIRDFYLFKELDYYPRKRGN